MKEFVITALAVLVGIWVYQRLARRGRPMMTGASGSVTTKDGNLFFSGLNQDPVTGASLAPGARPGTVEFPAQNN